MEKPVLEKPVLRGENIVKIFGKGNAQVRAVDSVSIEVTAGEMVTITGPSGSGKTTLVSILGALLRPSEGAVSIDGTDISTLNDRGLSALRARTIGFVFQSFNLLESLSLRDNVLFPANLLPGGRKSAEAHADELLERLGLTKRRNAMPATLSGGEKQRVAIARALVNKPKLIIADEPTGNLDSKSGQEVLMILHDIARDEGRAVLIVTHDRRVEDVADRILWLEDGHIRDRKLEEHEWVRDPVCSMRIDSWASEIFTDLDGERYHFCSNRCQDRFTSEPARYTAQVAEPSSERST